MMNRVALLALAVLAGCVKKEVPVQVKPPIALATDSVTFLFDPVIDKDTLVPEFKYYQNSSGDYYTVTMFNYYVSNVQLITSGGRRFSEPESYHLIRHVQRERSFTLAVPDTGNYTKIRFLIGVDSARNVSGAQTGALDPVKGMFWEWKSGYVFFKLEGDYVSKKVTTTSQYAIHVGGFSGPYNALQWVDLDLPTALLVNGGRKKTIRIKANINQVFTQPQDIGFDKYYPVTVGIFRDFSVNYRDMFTMVSVTN